MYLLAATRFGSLIGLPSVLLRLALISYLLFSPLPPHECRARVAISWFFVYVSLAFAAIWFWLNVALPLGAWMFVLGDRNSWFYDYASHIAAAIALIISCVAFVRGMAGAISRRYVQSLKWAPPILLLAAAAAQHLMKRFHKYNDSMHLEAHTGPSLFPDSPKDERTFWIVEGQEKIGLIMVWPNGILGWKQLRTHWFSDPTDILMDAQMYLDLGDQAKARYCLEQVIRSLPGTPAEKEARRLLNVKLGGSAVPPVLPPPSPAPPRKPASIPESLWTFKPKENLRLAASWHVGDTIFATVKDGSTLLALNATKGELRYRTTLIPKGPFITPWLVGQSPNGLLEFSTLHKIVEIDPATGASQQSFDIPHDPRIAPIQVGNDYVVVTSPGGYDVRRVGRQGNSVWERKLPGYVMRHPAVLGNLAIFQTRGQSYGGQQTLCLDLIHGRIVWKEATDAYGQGVAFVDETFVVESDHWMSPASAEGWIIGRQVQTGIPQWHYRYQGAIGHPPLVDRKNARIYGAFSSGHVVCLRASDGSELWRQSLTEGIPLLGAADSFDPSWHPHSLSGDTLHILDRNLVLHFLNADTGEVRQSINLAGDATSVSKLIAAPWPTADRLIVAYSDRVVALLLP
jgi:outer membrane protein assembly factor BamB